MDDFFKRNRKVFLIIGGLLALFAIAVIVNGAPVFDLN